MTASGHHGDASRFGHRRRSHSVGERALEKAVAAATLTYRCARCGKTFTAPVDGSAYRGARPCVVIGGRRWCEPCARARYPRRPDPDAPLGAARTPHPHWMKVR